MAIAIVIPLGLVSIALVLGKDWALTALAVLILFGLVSGMVIGFGPGGAIYRLYQWLKPKRVSPLDIYLATVTIVILAFLLTWMGWHHKPTNAQIDAIHADPRFAAAIAEMNEKKMDPSLVTEAMKSDHVRVSRPILFGVETLATSIVLGFLFVTYWVIFRALCAAFKPTAPAPEALD